MSNHLSIRVNFSSIEVSVVISEGVLFGHPCLITCDGLCHKAWGNDDRPRNQLSECEDDWEYLADEELPDAPVTPSDSAGDDVKPISIPPGFRHNRWCVRECERSSISLPGELITLPDLGKRLRNLKNQ